MILSIVLVVSALLIVIAFGLASYRLWRGPSLVDRVLAADAMALSIVGLMVLWVYRTGSLFALDVMLLTSLVGFITPVAFVDYLNNLREGEK